MPHAHDPTQKAPGALETVPADMQRAWLRVEEARLGSRMKRALRLVAHGVSYREAAAEEGYQDHAAVYRHARRFGLAQIRTEQIIEGHKSIAFLANDELERRLVERPEEFRDRDLSVAAGIASDKIRDYEGWKSEQQQGGDYVSALDRLARQLEANQTLKIGFTVEKSPGDREERAIDVTPDEPAW